MELEMEIKKQEQVLLNNFLFYFASLGAGSLIPLIIVLILKPILGLFGLDLSFSAYLWIFLFLLPGALSVSASFVSRALREPDSHRTDYGVLVGYAAYTLSSLVLLIFAHSNHLEKWLVPMFIFLILAVFFSKRLAGLFINTAEFNSQDDQTDDPHMLGKLNFLLVEEEETETESKETPTKKESVRELANKPVLLIRAPQDIDRDDN